jgi:prevent-host-death family protein
VLLFERYPSRPRNYRALDRQQALLYAQSTVETQLLAGNKYGQHGHVSYNGSMRTVNISDLKAQLSAHIQLVRDGEEVLVCDRNKPVARIVPCRLEGHSEQEQRLVARGVLTPPLKKRPASVSWPQPPGNIPDEVMEQVWREERESR